MFLLTLFLRFKTNFFHCFRLFSTFPKTQKGGLFQFWCLYVIFGLCSSRARQQYEFLIIHRLRRIRCWRVVDVKYLMGYTWDTVRYSSNWVDSTWDNGDIKLHGLESNFYEVDIRILVVSSSVRNQKISLNWGNSWYQLWYQKSNVSSVLGSNLTNTIKTSVF